MKHDRPLSSHLFFFVGVALLRFPFHHFRRIPNGSPCIRESTIPVYHRSLHKMGKSIYCCRRFTAAAQISQAAQSFRGGRGPDSPTLPVQTLEDTSRKPTVAAGHSGKPKDRCLLFFAFQLLPPCAHQNLNPSHDLLRRSEHTLRGKQASCMMLKPECSKPPSTNEIRFVCMSQYDVVLRRLGYLQVCTTSAENGTQSRDPGQVVIYSTAN